ncbi:hypothetical protein MU516_16865 [Paracoccus sp. YLB-12]|uniref:Uncharacterized protein n=1 Tax=Paracoccus maritimus TaxID=2933292 RepID=A0ABT2KEY7_9RHOB|nr:hypothetical protein [Paracoccus sp. YLB-12]MCT4334529.1 hypothetical protein [Paracoccus sp. YLB-12]
MNSRVLGGLCAIAAFGLDQGTKALALNTPALERGVEVLPFLNLVRVLSKRRLCPTFLVFTRSEILRLTEIVREFRDGDYGGVSQGLWGRHPTERAAALAG